MSESFIKDVFQGMMGGEKAGKEPFQARSSLSLILWGRGGLQSVRYASEVILLQDECSLVWYFCDQISPG